MKKFHFSLSAVHELRQAEEQVAQKAFAEAVRIREEASGRLAAGERALQDAWQLLRQGSAQAMQAVQMAHARLWCSVLDERREQLEENLKQCEARLETAHQLLKAAAQRREAMDRTLARQRRIHERELQREEQKFLDEIATRGAWHGEGQMEAA